MNVAILKSINRHPSFDHDPENMSVESRVQKIQSVSKQGRWLIPYDEVKIESEPFAEGAHAYVYAGMWRGLKVAVKCMKEYKVQEILDLFREIEIWSTVRHPYLAQFLGVVITPSNEVYIVMEKIRGSTLKKVLKRGCMTLDTKFDIIYQLSTILYFLHNCNPPILYRDLKPENVLIESVSGCVKLVDFGLSRFFRNEIDSPYNLTGETGTKRYMAPEVYNNLPYSYSVDVYSLGLIMYEMFANEQPFEKMTSTEIAFYFNPVNQSSFPMKRIKQKRIEQIIKVATHRDPHQRPNAREIYESFEQIWREAKKKKCILM